MLRAPCVLADQNALGSSFIGAFRITGYCASHAERTRDYAKHTPGLSRLLQHVEHQTTVARGDLIEPDIVFRRFRVRMMTLKLTAESWCSRKFTCVAAELLKRILTFNRKFFHLNLRSRNTSCLTVSNNQIDTLLEGGQWRSNLRNFSQLAPRT